MSQKIKSVVIWLRSVRPDFYEVILKRPRLRYRQQAQEGLDNGASLYESIMSRGADCLPVRDPLFSSSLVKIVHSV